MCASWARTPSETPRAVASPMGSAATPSNGLAAATAATSNARNADRVACFLCGGVTMKNVVRGCNFRSAAHCFAIARNAPASVWVIAANNYASGLVSQERFKEAKALLRNLIPVARRVLRDRHDLTLRMRKIYTRALYEDPGATLDDLNEAVEMLEETTRTARRVLGGAHPLTAGIEVGLRRARAALRVLWCPRIAVFEEFCDLGW